MFTPAPRQGRVSLAYSLAPLSGGYQHTGEVVPQHSKLGWPDDEGVPPQCSAISCNLAATTSGRALRSSSPVLGLQHNSRYSL